MRYLIVYLAAINLLTFCVYGADKRRAKIPGARRVPEKTLFALALLLGSPGALLGMLVFRHKTRHWYFRFGIPAILLAKSAAAVFLAQYFSLKNDGSAEQSCPRFRLYRVKDPGR